MYVYTYLFREYVHFGKKFVVLAEPAKLYVLNQHLQANRYSHF